MSFRFPWRRYFFLVLLFLFCLSAVLLLDYQATSTQLISLNKEIVLEEKQSPILAKQNSLSIAENVRQTVLANGLTVLTKEVHSATVVSVQVWYQVGSGNETTGVNGISHQLEHMLFKGTTNRPIQFGRLFSALGSDSNAFTSYDHTAYYGTAERNKLKTLLLLEADRMQNALINAEQLESEKRVVISELQGYENYPSYRLYHAVMRATFPHQAVGLPVGGTKADVEKFTVEKVRDYYRKYYTPENATLVIVGDFQTEPTLQAIREIFGNLPSVDRKQQRQEKEENRGNKEARRISSLTQNVPPTAAPTKLKTPPSPQSPIVLREPGSAALLEVIYPLPAITTLATLAKRQRSVSEAVSPWRKAIAHSDVPALKVMDYILTGGRSSRLYQALVESGLASDISGYVLNLSSIGWYELSATAAPGQELGKIEEVLQQAIASLQDQEVTAEELDRAKTQLQAEAILQNRDITSQAIQLGNDQTTTGDYRYTDHFVNAVMQVSAADVQQVARNYLNSANRTIGFFEPTQLEGYSGTVATNSTSITERFSPGMPVDPAEVAKYLPALLDPETPTANQVLPEQFTLDNHLQVLLLPDRSTSTVTLSGQIRSGTQFDPPNLAGLANMTAENLMNGTTTKDSLTLAKILDSRGANLGFSTSREGIGINGYSLAKDLPTVIETLADVVQNASFPADEVELSRQRILSNLKVSLDSPWYLSRRMLQQTIYPENHPFHTFPTEESLKQITRQEILDFYQKHYRPDTMVLTLLGDFEPAAVRSLLIEKFGNWQADGQPPFLNFPQVLLPERVIRLNPIIPGKTQATIQMGYGGIDRKDPRYYAVLVLNQILGGDTLASRLGTEIRDRQGLTYGIYSNFLAGQQPGPFVISMQTAPEDTQRAIASTLALLKQIRAQGLKSTEVAAAKASLTSSYTVTLANPDSLAEEILKNQVYMLTTAEIRDFPRKVQAVTLAQVNQAAKELLYPDRLVVVTAGPAVAAYR